MPAHASFPGENGLIAYVGDRDTPEGSPLDKDEIYVRCSQDQTGTKPIRLTNILGRTARPVSPNGKEIVFQEPAATPSNSRTRAATTSLYVMSAERRRRRRQRQRAPATDRQQVSDGGAAWSPGGKKIAFSSTRDGDSDIYVMDPEDPPRPSDLRRELPGAARPFDGQPVFLPDGTRIAFISARVAGDRTWVMNADSWTDPDHHAVGNPARVLPPMARSSAFTSARDGDGDIYVIDAAPEGPANVAVNLTNGLLNPYNGGVSDDRWPAWSPDGRTIAYFGFNAGLATSDSDIYLIGADRTSSTNLTQTPVGCGEINPDWGPARHASAEFFLPRALHVRPPPPRPGRGGGARADR